MTRTIDFELVADYVSNAVYDALLALGVRHSLAETVANTAGADAYDALTFHRDGAVSRGIDERHMATA
jgi:hypothetical protein